MENNSDKFEKDSIEDLKNINHNYMKEFMQSMGKRFKPPMGLNLKTSDEWKRPTKVRELTKPIENIVGYIRNGIYSEIQESIKNGEIKPYKTATPEELIKAIDKYYENTSDDCSGNRFKPKE